AQDLGRRKKGDECTVFYHMRITGRELVAAILIPQLVLDIIPLPRGRFLLTCLFNPRRADLDTLDDKERSEEKNYEVLEEIPYWSNGEGFVSGCRTRLYLFDEHTGALEPLSGELLQVSGCELNSTRDKAVFVGAEYQGKAQFTNALYLADLEQREVRQITAAHEFTYHEAHFYSDNELICWGSDCRRYGLNENPRFYLINITAGTKTP